MTDGTVQQSFPTSLKSRALAFASYLSAPLSTGIKIAAVIGLVIVFATAHLWARAWWQSFRDVVFPAEGQIIVGSPAVYTRQRLVNDRLSQTSWLQEQLRVTEGIDSEFRGIDEVQ